MSEPLLTHLLQEYIQQQEEGQSKIKQRVLILEESLRAQAALMQRADTQLSDAVARLPSVDAACEEIADIPKIKQRIQQLSQSTQGLQEQILQLKKQNAENMDRSYSRCSSLRSSVMLNPTALGFLNKRGTKSMKKLFFMDQEQPTPKLLSSPPKTAEAIEEEAVQEQIQRPLPVQAKDSRLIETTRTSKSVSPVNGTCPVLDCAF